MDPKWLFSPDANNTQEDLLDACDWFGEAELKKRLYSLLSQNRYFEGFD